MPKARMFSALLDYLTAEGVVPPTLPPVRATPLEALLVRYGRHLTEVRGLAASTVSLRQRVAERFLSGRSVMGDEVGVAGLCGDDPPAAPPSRRRPARSPTCGLAIIFALCDEVRHLPYPAFCCGLAMGRRNGDLEPAGALLGGGGGGGGGLPQLNDMGESSRVDREQG